MYDASEHTGWKRCHARKLSDAHSAALIAAFNKTYDSSADGHLYPYVERVCKIYLKMWLHNSGSALHLQRGNLIARAIREVSLHAYLRS